MKKLLVIAGLVWSLAACSTNPVTGKRQLSMMSEAQELQVGKQQYEPGRQTQGGDYVADPQVQAYVNKVGQRLASVSERKLPYEFKVINSSVPNAWALPGGKIAINRGLLTELQSESELAAVLGHEVVHAAAGHGSSGVAKGTLAQIALIGVQIATAGEDYADIARVGASGLAQGAIAKYGRDAEREADEYGIQYMVRAGYDPQGAVDLQKTFVQLSKDRRQDFLSGLFASHPPSQERVENNRRLVAKLNAGGDVGRERYQQNMGRLLRTKPAYDAFEDAMKAANENDFRTAKSLINRAIRMEPNEGHFHSALGDIEAEGKNFRGAIQHYNKAISLNRGFFLYHLKKGMASEEARDYRNATASLNQSIKILETPHAHYSLGNIARASGQNDRAIQHYTKAAGSNSEIGKKALGSLAELDLATNPGKYIATKAQLNSDGTLAVLIKNNTPRNVGRITLKVIYLDANGRQRELTESINGVLQPGKVDKINTRLTVTPAMAKNIKTGVVRAAIVR